MWEYTEDEEIQEPERRGVADSVGQPRKSATYCPVEQCPRHSKGFSRSWNLSQHLKSKHPGMVVEKTKLNQPVS
jgi:hypothetical protein